MSDIAKAKRTKNDAYANVAFAYVVQTAINTLVFEQIQMAVGLFQGIAMVIHRLSYFPNSLAELQVSADDLTMALVTSNRLSAISDVSDPAIIDSVRIQGVGAATTTNRVHTPIVSDYTTMPGGGKIVSANPLYFALNTAAFAAVTGARLKLEFTFVTLTDRDYLEIIQSQFPANIS